MGASDPIVFTLGTSEERAIRVVENGTRRTDLSDITRWIAVIAGVSIDSDTNPECFDWTSSGAVDTDGTSDVLVLFLGGLDLPLDETNLVLTYYDPSHPLGRQFDNAFPALVRGAATGAVPAPPDPLPDGAMYSIVAATYGLPANLRRPATPDVGGEIRGRVAADVAMGHRMGDGRFYNPLGNQNDIVLRTCHNRYGGTNGATTVRFIVLAEITIGGGLVEFAIQFNAANLAGLDVQVGRADPDAVAGPDWDNVITQPFMVHDGTGGYTYSYTPTSGNVWQGFYVTCTPQDATNDATLHDEHWVIESISLKQNSVDLIDSNADLSGTDWARWVRTQTSPVWMYQTLGNGWLKHYGVSTGRLVRFQHVAPWGTSSGDGTEADPVDFDTALTQGVRTLLLAPGTYTPTTGLREVVDIDGIVEPCTLVCLDGHATVKGSTTIAAATWAASTNHFTASWDYAGHWDATKIGLGTAWPKILFGDSGEPALVASAILCDATENSYFYDRSGKVLHVNFPDATPVDVEVAENGYPIYQTGGGLVGLLNVDFTYFDASVKLAGCTIRAENCAVVGVLKPVDAWDIDDADGVWVGCSASRAANDGWNFHGTGHTELYNCTANDNIGDGISHHDACTGLIVGGSYKRNGKANVIPAFGAQVTCWDVDTEQALGTHATANEWNWGGFTVLGDEGYNPTLMVCVRCTATAERWGFLAAGYNATAVLVDTDSVTCTVGRGVQRWDSSPTPGNMVVVRHVDTGSTDDVDNWDERRVAEVDPEALFPITS